MTDNLDPKAIETAMQYQAGDADYKRSVQYLLLHPEEIPQSTVADRKTIWTADELLTTEFPDPNWIIPQLIPEGMTFIGGRPKIGKSWMALQIAIACASGGMVFGKKVEKGEVLYISLEDNARRLKSRLNLMGVGPGLNLQIATEWLPLHKGGIDQLFIEIMSNRYRLIIIDPLNRAFPGQDQNDSMIIASITQQIQHAAITQNETVIFTDHTRKANGFNSDPIDDIIGQTNKPGAADMILALYRQQGKAGTNMKGRGRDVEEIDSIINFDAITHCWQLVGGAAEVVLSEAKAAVLRVLEDLGKSQLAAISSAAGRDRSNTLGHLSDLIATGKVKKETIGDKVYFAKL